MLAGASALTIATQAAAQGSYSPFNETATAALARYLRTLASDPKELTVVNIVGPVDLDKLTQLEGQFGIPELEIKQEKPKQKN